MFLQNKILSVTSPTILTKDVSHKCLRDFVGSRASENNESTLNVKGDKSVCPILPYIIISKVCVNTVPLSVTTRPLLSLLYCIVFVFVFVFVYALLKVLVSLSVVVQILVLFLFGVAVSVSDSISVS